LEGNSHRWFPWSIFERKKKRKEKSITTQKRKENETVAVMKICSNVIVNGKCGTKVCYTKRKVLPLLICIEDYYNYYYYYYCKL